MSDIIGEVIIGLLALIGTIIGSVMVSQKTIWRIEQLEKATERHNQVISRVFLLEHDSEEQKEEIRLIREELERVRNGAN